MSTNQLDPQLQARVDRFYELAHRVFAKTISIPEMIEFKGISLMLSAATIADDLPADTFDMVWLHKLARAVKAWGEETLDEMRAAFRSVQRERSTSWN